MREIITANNSINQRFPSPNNDQRDLYQRAEDIAAKITQLEMQPLENLSFSDIKILRTQLDDLEQSSTPVFGFGQALQQLKLDTTLFDNLNSRLDKLETQLSSYHHSTPSTSNTTLGAGRNQWTMV